jgi:hypothetical protein
MTWSAISSCVRCIWHVFIQYSDSALTLKIYISMYLSIFQYLYLDHFSLHLTHADTLILTFLRSQRWPF